MTDQLVKALAYDDQVRIYIVNATETVNEAHTRHDTWHTATAAFGRTLVATVLLSASLKGDDRLSVNIDGSGPIKRLVADGDNLGNVRGIVGNPHVALELNDQGKLDVSGAIGLPGSLVVRKYIGDGEPFSGQVPLVSGELGEDFTYYMAVSEQTPSAIGLSVLVNPDESVQVAGGFMIQMLPGASEETITSLEESLNNLGSFSALLDQGLTTDELLDRLVGADNYRTISSNSVQYTCTCSKEHFADRLQTISPDDLKDMIETDHGAEVICHYCGEKYHYNELELSQILEEANQN